MTSRVLSRRERVWLAVLFGAVLAITFAWRAIGPDTEVRPVGAALGGATSRAGAGEDAFALPAANLPKALNTRFFEGQRLFNLTWVVAPSTIGQLDGRGPTFNRPSCSGCHFKDGRGRPPAESGGAMNSMLVRLSVPGAGPRGGPKPHPAYGGQLQERANPGIPPEGRAFIDWKTVTGRYGDGAPYALRRPVLRFGKLAFGPLGAKILTSPRVAPQLVGMGLIDAIPDDAIRRRADPGDRNRDGISGRVNVVWDRTAKRLRPGRYGWKAGHPTLEQQIADAYRQDMGITNRLYPRENCPPVQTACAAAPNGGQPEVSDRILADVTFYISSLAVPLRRKAKDGTVRRGEALFTKIGCAACHVPTFRTGKHPTIPGLSNQVIHPFSDFLLHDMGPGLADARPEFRATGREWRTPPLWGIGLVPAVNGHRLYLHDGRARGLAEAILWHGGEAERAKQRFRQLPKAARDALIAFLRSL